MCLVHVGSIVSKVTLDQFSPPVREWFSTSFPEPTPPQTMGWPAIANGDNTLILAPTGSGKTLTAFLWGIDRLTSDPTPADDPHTRIIYISPLRALAVDVDKNLRRADWACHRRREAWCQGGTIWLLQRAQVYSPGASARRSNWQSPGSVPSHSLQSCAAPVCCWQVA